MQTFLFNALNLLMQYFRLRVYNDSSFYLGLLFFLIVPVVLIDQFHLVSSSNPSYLVFSFLPFVAFIILYFSLSGRKIDIELNEKSVRTTWYTSLFTPDEDVEIYFEDIASFYCSSVIKRDFDTFYIITRDQKKFSITCVRIFISNAEYTKFINAFRENYYAVYPEKKRKDLIQVIRSKWNKFFKKEL